MEFYEYITHYMCFKKIDPNLTSSHMIAMEREITETIDSGCKSQFLVESKWHESNRPYFNIYPSMAEVLSKINYDFHCDQVKWPKNLDELPFSIRFAKGHKSICINENGRDLQSIMAVLSNNIVVGKSQVLEKGLVIFANFGVMPEYQLPETYWISFPLRDGVSLEEVIKTYLASSDEAAPYYKFLDVIIRVVVGLLLLAEDKDYCIPDVLTKHKAKYAENQDEKYITKAIRNGKYGWTVGENLESVPHFRRPHFGFRYTGTGRSIRKLVPIKGAIVNRQKIQLPQGYQDEL